MLLAHFYDIIYLYNVTANADNLCKGVDTMANAKLTEKQQTILQYIKESILKRGYPPAVREICQAVNLRSTSSVHAHLESLERKGYIRKDPSKPRTIEVVDESFNLTRREMVNVPLLGEVAAGVPMFAEENISDYFPFPADMLPNTDIFMLKVKGDSMVNVGIFDNDKILVAKQNHANNGDIVVALMDDTATVKTYYKEKNHIRLQPQNDDMEPILVKDVSILGKVIGLFRMM